MQAGGASWFGRLGVGIAAAGVIMGTMLGDPMATTGRAPRTEPVPVESPASGKREAFYVSDAINRASVVLAPLGLDRDGVLRSLTNASVSVQVDRGHLLQQEGSSVLEIRPGTRLTSEVGHYGISVHAAPSLAWRADWAPDAEIERLSYDFGDGAFRVSASGLGPDALYERIITGKANDHLRPRLPRDMQQPGYSLWSDRELERNLQMMIDILRASKTGGAASAAASDNGLSALEVSLSFRAPETRLIPLPDTELSARLEAGTDVDLQVRFSGPIEEPRLESLVIRFDRELEIAEGVEERSSLKKMDVRSMTLTPGGQVELDYELGPEQMVDGVKALVALFVVMAEPRANLPAIERTRMEGARRQVQERIDGDVEPRLADLIREHDAAIPGLSLVDVFGISR